MKKNFAVHGKQLSLVTTFTGTESITAGDQVLSSIGGLKYQFSFSRAHKFEFEGDCYVIESKATKIEATVNGRPEPVEMLPMPPDFTQYNAVRWVRYFVIGPVLATAFFIYQYSKAPLGGYALGGLIGELVGVALFVGFGVYLVRKKPEQPCSTRRASARA